jgi:hypothetical protein
MKTKIKKIIYKTKLVWNMGGLKHTRWIGQREP